MARMDTAISSLQRRRMGREELRCRHIYEDVGHPTCPDCGRDTHEYDWKLQAKLNREWIKKNGARYGGWWSI